MITASIPLVSAAQDPVPPPRLTPVMVTVTRDAARSLLELPLAVTVIADSVNPGRRRNGLDELLRGVPGVAVASRSNPAQDPRISIRGFGARSAFGVRSIRVLHDGVPITLPDGQTPTDHIDVESVGTVQVIRGPASSLYGNASGGVVDFQSAAPPSVPLSVGGRVVLSDLGLRDHTPSAERALFGGTKAVATVGGTLDSTDYQATATHSESKGWRDYARQRSTTIYARSRYHHQDLQLGLQASLYVAPDLQNPGALTREQFAADPRQADPVSVAKGAGKRVDHRQLSMTAERALDHGTLSAVVYGSARTLDNPLTFAVVDLARRSYGALGRGSFTLPLWGASHRITAGIDAEWQRDARQNFANCTDATPGRPTQRCPANTGQRGIRLLDQNESIESRGAFVRDEILFSNRYHLVVGARADEIDFRVDDHLNPIATSGTGERVLRAVSPMAGVTARLGSLHSAYANVSTAFETPTTTELGNKADGSSGINPDLRPQGSTTYELGIKGYAHGLRYDAAAFRTGVHDELVQFQVPGGIGRSYFRNAGRTDRRGAELGLTATLGSVDATMSYAYSNFRFVEYAVDLPGQPPVNYAGNEIPGVPRHLLQGSLTWRRAAGFMTAELVTQSQVRANDANSVAAAGHQVLNLRAGGTEGGGLAGAGMRWLTPVIGVHNVFDQPYAGSVVLNAVLGKYYEPAPGRSVYVALSIHANSRS
ncbi:MAG: TonB-dependent receptor [Gemmatimonadaceae bacterium]